MILRSKTTWKARAAFTLVELLIVMAVVVLVAAVTLPSIREMLSDQKVGQAANVVQAYFHAAQSRAEATGRPVAVVLDRLRYDAGGGVTPEDALVANNTCIRLSTGDVFPPYQGDWAGAKGALGDTNADGFADMVSIPFSQAASLVDA